jgi:hypothetical protein
MGDFAFFAGRFKAPFMAAQAVVVFHSPVGAPASGVGFLDTRMDRSMA